jgi:glutaminase
MDKLAGLTQTYLDRLTIEAQAQARCGNLPAYIPLLSNPNRCLDLAMRVQRIDGQIFSVGAKEYRFPLMSISKPFVLLYLLQQSNRDLVLDRVSLRPSEYPYNSIAQLELDRYQPRNPMINSGAIALAALLPGETAWERCQNLCDWLNECSGSQLSLDVNMLESVRSQPNPINHTIAHLLYRHRQIDANGWPSAREIDIALDTYEHTSCISGTLEDLTKLGLLLAQPRSFIPQIDRSKVNAVMFSCGLYEESHKYAIEIGLPIKSGVSGGLLAIVPSEGAIAIYSPPLNPAGNTVAGLYAIEQLARSFNLSVFE